MDRDPQLSEEILSSKLKIIADRNERFAMINQEILSLRTSMLYQVQELRAKITRTIHEETEADD